MGAKKVYDPQIVMNLFMCNRPSKAPIYLGIDPGTSGAIGLICGFTHTAIDIPVVQVKRGKGKGKEFDLGAIIDLMRMPIEARSLVRCVVEKPPPTMGGGPGKGSAYAQFYLGCAYAMWPLFLTSRFAHPPVSVMASVWKKDMGIGTDKEANRKKAVKLFPKAPLDRKMDHNRAEALLLAEYLKRKVES